MSAHVFFNLLNELGKTIRCEALHSSSIHPFGGLFMAILLKFLDYDIVLFW